MASGLKPRTRLWYETQIKNILRKHGKATTATIVAELIALNQRRYPITTDRIVALLKELRARGEVVSYATVPEKKSVLKWQVKD